MIISKRVNNWTIIAICFFAVLAMALAHNAPQYNKWYFYKKEAAKLMYGSELAIARRAEEMGIRVDEDLIKKKSRLDIATNRLKVIGYLIGEEDSPLVSAEGALYSKIACTDPNFAAVIVEFLREAGVREGDTIAVSLSGSLPGAGIAVFSASKAMDLNPIIISSLGASSWGATKPELTLLDMERILYEEGVFSFRSQAASMGGFWDIQKKKSDSEKIQLAEIVKRNDLFLIYEDDVTKNTEQRMEIYTEYAGKNPIKAFVNVGGDSAVVGRKKYRKYIPTGLFFELPLDKFPRKGVTMYMVEKGVPVVNIKNIKRFVRLYDLDPVSARFPAIGRGEVYRDRRYDAATGAAALLSVIVVCGVLIWVDVYFLPWFRRKVASKRPF